MQSIDRLITAGLLASAALLAAGKQNPTPANTAEVRVSSEMIPPGGTVQVKFSLTEPQPITSTGSSFAMGVMSVDGVAVWSPAGDAGGVGVLNNGQLHISAISPSGNLGNGLDYPFLTITSDIPASVKYGSSFPLTLGADSSISTAAGPMTLLVKPGRLDVKGSVSIHGVYPGGGNWPAGTVVKVLGSGFQAGTKVTTKFAVSSIYIVSSGEIDLTLKDQTYLDSQAVTVQHPDRSSDRYFCYLRGVPVRVPSRTLLQHAEPAFPLQSHAIASLVVPDLSSSQFAALALQNANPGPLVVTFQLVSRTAGTQSTTVTLPSGTRIVDDLSSLLDGYPVAPGDTLQLTATAPLQILGLLGDESAFTVAPFFPVF